MQLSKNHQFFSAFLKCRKIFNTFKKIKTLRGDVFRKLRIPKNVVRYMSKKSHFRKPFDKQQGKWDQTVLKS